MKNRKFILAIFIAVSFIYLRSPFLGEVRFDQKHRKIEYKLSKKQSSQLQKILTVNDYFDKLLYFENTTGFIDIESMQNKRIFRRKTM